MLSVEQLYVENMQIGAMVHILLFLACNAFLSSLCFDSGLFDMACDAFLYLLSSLPHRLLYFTTQRSESYISILKRAAQKILAADNYVRIVLGGKSSP